MTVPTNCWKDFSQGWRTRSTKVIVAPMSKDINAQGRYCRCSVCCPAVEVETRVSAARHGPGRTHRYANNFPATRKLAGCRYALNKTFYHPVVRLSFGKFSVLRISAGRRWPRRMPVITSLHVQKQSMAFDGEQTTLAGYVALAHPSMQPAHHGTRPNVASSLRLGHPSVTATR